MGKMKQLAITIIIVGWLAGGCVGVPDGVTPVRNFELERYLGTWYEIARLDHSFERGLTNVTATYSMRDDGGVKVINRGYNTDDGKWETAEGRAYFVDDPDTGRLKVSFFWIFYGGYNIIALDQENYEYALVCGPDTGYLWILAREPDLEQTVIDNLVKQAEAANFPTNELIWVAHDRHEGAQE